MLHSAHQVLPSILPSWPWTISLGAGLDALNLPSADSLFLAVLPPQEQLAQFIDTLFEPSDLVEIRVIASPANGSSMRSQLVDRKWVVAEGISEHFAHLKAHNEAGCHVFFGVNPRTRNAGTKNAVLLCRSVWLDLDCVTFEEATARWSTILPEPTIVVRSGSGIHAYWRLESPQDVSTLSARSRFEKIVKGLSRAVGADATHDVTRLLRLPGFQNPKTSVSLPCELLVCEAQRQYPIATFEGLQGTLEAQTSTEPAAIGCIDGRMPQRIEGLMRHLDREVTDRSRRDFAVVCGLLRFGLCPDQIRSLVAGHSKFASNDTYFETTVQNALRQLGMSSNRGTENPS